MSPNNTESLVTPAEIFPELRAVIAEFIQWPDDDNAFNGLWIKDSTPLTGAPPPDSCDFDPQHYTLGQFAGHLNAAFDPHLDPPIQGADLDPLPNVGKLADLICKRWKH